METSSVIVKDVYIKDTDGIHRRLILKEHTHNNEKFFYLIDHIRLNNNEEGEAIDYNEKEIKL